MKKFLIVIGIIASSAATAQQLPLYSQYMFNPYLLNPAFGGSMRTTPISLGIRSQWVGFDDAPKTQVISMHGLKGEKHGIGGYLFNDKTGPLSRTGLQLSYAHHLTLKEGLKLSLSAAGLVYQNTLDKTKLTSDIPNDVALQGGKVRSVTPDATFGTYLYHDKYFVGLSIPHLLQSNLKTGSSKLNTLARHYFATAGYRYNINYDFMLEPSVLIKRVGGAPVQADLNLKAVFQRMIWAGVSYRTQDAVVAMLGVTRGLISAGYSYDFTMSEMKHVSSGSHEIFLSYNIGGNKPVPSSRPAKLPDPTKEEEEKKDEVGPDDKKPEDVGPDDKEKIKIDDDGNPKDPKQDDQKTPEVGPKTPATKGGKRKI